MTHDSDMHGISASATAARALGLRAWYLEYDCQGVPYTWRGEAANESAADSLARHVLSVRHHGFNSARATLTACLEA